MSSLPPPSPPSPPPGEPFGSPPAGGPTAPPFGAPPAPPRPPTPPAGGPPPWTTTPPPAPAPSSASTAPPTAAYPTVPPSTVPPTTVPPTTVPPAQAYIPAPGAVVATGKVRPSAGWYVLAGLLMAAGVATFITLLVIGITRLVDRVDTFERIVVDGDVRYDVTFGAAGKYLLYYERNAVVEGTSYAGPTDAPSMTVTLTGGDGSDVPIRTDGRVDSISTDGRKMTSVYAVSVPIPGRYQLHVTPSGDPGPFVMAIGTDVLGDLGRTVLLGAGVGAALFLLGVALLVITIVRRSKAKKARRQAQSMSYAASYGGPYGGYGQPGGPQGGPWPGP